MSITAHGNPEVVNKICEWTKKPFTTDWKHRHQRFIDTPAMYAWRKANSHEVVNCKHCGKPFERRKNEKHHHSGLPPQYCSQTCCAKSDNHRNKSREWTTKNQPMKSAESRQKISITKLKRYGSSSYNNMEKNRETCLRKYGVACYFDHPDCIKSNGTRISKFQTQTYKEIFKKHPDALLEVYLPDVKKSVDIYIPSEKKIIECYGDYWHCNPSKCKSDYYNEAMHMTAQEIWDRDTKKQDNLKSHGYSVDIVWENTNKKFRHSVKDSMK